MISKQYGKYVLICDICEEIAEAEFNTFHDAADGRKEIG